MHNQKDVKRQAGVLEAGRALIHSEVQVVDYVDMVIGQNDQCICGNSSTMLGGLIVMKI